ncbi:MAG: GNAT family N-acetyltransferase [Candidatus Saganbacteria bacterium]|nr:GNAT family N-acetyltransferase [Candidatus Saganbacteria bacterium]
MRLISRSFANRPVVVRFFPCQFRADSTDWQKMRDDIVGLSRDVYKGKVVGSPPGYWEERVERYLQPKTQAKMGAAWDDGTLAGFAITRGLMTSEGETFHFVLSFIASAFQGTGVSTYLLTKLCDQFMADRNLDETWLSFDTPNPVALGTMTKYLIDPYPDPRQPNKNPTEAVRNLAQAIASQLYQDANFDPDRFVVHDWYFRTKSLLYLADKVPQYKEKAVNDFCFLRLRPQEERGNKMLVIGRVNKEMTQTIVNYFEGS